jgi:hypothetical protein
MPIFDPHFTTYGALTDRANYQDVLTKNYYKQRAAEYEDIRNRLDPERQSEQKDLAAATNAALWRPSAASQRSYGELFLVGIVSTGLVVRI